MSHWLNHVVEILESSTGDLRKLAVLAGCDPKTFYKFQDLSNCDLRGQDLRGMDFTGCNIMSAKLNEHTLIDRDFDDRYKPQSEHTSYFIPIELDVFVQDFAFHAGYYYMAWAYKNLMSRFYRTYNFRNGEERALKFISDNKNFYEFCIKDSRSPKIEIRFLTHPHQKNLLDHFSLEYSHLDSIVFFLLHSLLSWKLRGIKERDYSDLTLRGVWPGAFNAITYRSSGQ